MPKLLILIDEQNEYLDIVLKENLPDLEIVTDPAECDIVACSSRPRLRAAPASPDDS